MSQPDGEDRRREDQRYAAYLDERKALDQGRIQAVRDLDQYLITISSGSLGLSILVLERAGPSPSAMWMLGSSWVLTGIALAAALVSLMVAARAWERAMEILDAEYAASRPDFSDFVPPRASWAAWWAQSLGRCHPWSPFLLWWAALPNPAAVSARWLNRFALVTFLCGAAALLLFAEANVPIRSPDRDERPREERSSPTPTAAPPVRGARVSAVVTSVAPTSNLAPAPR